MNVADSDYRKLISNLFAYESIKLNEYDYLKPQILQFGPCGQRRYRIHVAIDSIICLAIFVFLFAARLRGTHDGPILNVLESLAFSAVFTFIIAVLGHFMFGVHNVAPSASHMRYINNYRMQIDNDLKYYWGFSVWQYIHDNYSELYQDLAFMKLLSYNYEVKHLISDNVSLMFNIQKLSEIAALDAKLGDANQIKINKIKNSVDNELNRLRTEVEHTYVKPQLDRAICKIMQKGDPKQLKLLPNNLRNEYANSLVDKM